MMISFDPYMQWYEVTSEGISHQKKVKGHAPDEPFNNSGPPTKYTVYYSISKKQWMCPCEAYRFSKYSRHCKHIRKVLEYRAQRSGIQNDDC